MIAVVMSLTSASLSQKSADEAQELARRRPGAPTSADGAPAVKDQNESLRASLRDSAKRNSRTASWLRWVAVGQAVVFLSMIARVLGSRIVVDGRGVKCVGLYRNRFIAWTEIRHFEWMTMTWRRGRGPSAVLRDDKVVNLLGYNVTHAGGSRLVAELNAAQAELLAHTFE